VSDTANDAPDTVTDAVNLLTAEGYTANFGVRDRQLQCGACGVLQDPTLATIERIFRFEGASDPDDEAIVLGVTCPNCDLKGVIVAGYGPSADPDEVAVITSMVDRR
jgi:hypothetical protein